MSRHTFVTLFISALFVAPALFLLRLHSIEEGVPFVPKEHRGDTRELALTFQVKPETKEKVSRREFRFWLPDLNDYWQVVDEQFNSGPFSLVILKEEKRRLAILSARSLVDEELHVDYRLLLKRIRKTQPPTLELETSFDFDKKHTASFEKLFSSFCGEKKKKKLATCFPKFFRAYTQWSEPVHLLALEKKKAHGELLPALLGEVDVAARFVFALPLSGYQASVQPRQVLLLQTDEAKEPFAFDLRSEAISPASQYFIWGDDQEIVRSERGFKEVSLSIASGISSDFSSGKEVKEARDAAFRYLSIQRLPLSTQALFEFTLLLPVAALVICLIRNLIGLVTFGTFMPALLGLSFVQTGLVSGMILSVLILGTGCLARLAADRLHMLLVPRLTAVLTTVTILFYLLTQVSFDWGWQSGLEVSLFPVVVLTMMVERLTLILDELGPLVALGRLFNTLISALACYFLLVQEEVQYLFFHFPELNLAVLGIAILFGRYTGYRLVELFRFRELVRG